MKQRKAVENAVTPALTKSPSVNDDGRKGYTVQIAMMDDVVLRKLAGMEANSNAKETEDQFKNYYLGGSAGNSYAVIKPPYSQDQLWRLSQENNSLLPCIDAYVTNIDGTGFVVTADDLKPEDADKDPEIKALWDFFNEVWPGESFISVRKKVRRDRHTVGNGYMEIVRNLAGDVTFIRHVDAKTMRIVQLDEPTPVTKMFKRWGKELEITTYIRERRYAQIINQGGEIIYFKEFGATRHLNKRTGAWEAPGAPVPLADRATEILHFIDVPDATSPYGVPRWITQLPSVLGSRKAEEFNMDFFDNGGIPPALVILQGGMLAASTRQQIENLSFVKAAKKQRLMVVEAEPTGGTLDQAGTVKVTVERFGTERQNDSMFEKYDDKCEQRVRRAFRLPPIFVGASTDYNFATAYASYTVAEAQVFRPEREDFDDMFSLRVMPFLRVPDAKSDRAYRIRSLPLQIQEATTKLEAVKTAMETGYVSPSTIVGTLNEIGGLNMKVEEKQVMPTQHDVQGGKAPTKDLNGQTGLPNGKVNPVAA
ncbi:capsid portal protein [Rhizobium phage RHph_Y1_11]|nr:capsid portal protein [Rhizobium phage RHph_Y1_11]